MTTKAKATATKELHIIARIQFKNDARKVCYQVKSSNGKDVYTTCLFQGKPCSCSCPAKGLNCYHCTGCEKLEATRTPAQVAEPVVKAQPVATSAVSTSEQRATASLNGNRAFSFMR